MNSIKVLVWNMDYWKSKYKNEAWEYVKSVKPDIALLNECSPELEGYHIAHHAQKHSWGVGVFSRSNLEEIEIDLCHPASAVASLVHQKNQEITAISLYGQMFDGFSIPTLHRTLSDLTPLLYSGMQKKMLLIGGDMNASEQFDERKPAHKSDRSHGIFFDRLKNFGLYDCLEKFQPGRIQTLRHKKSKYPYQNDYLFGSKKMYDSCQHCEVINDPHLHKISDHNPILADFRVAN